MKKRSTLASALIVVGFGVGLGFLLFRIGEVAGFARWLLSAASSLAWGGVIAFILNVPMRAIERLLGRIDRRHRLRRGHMRALSLLMTLALLCGVVYLVFTLMIPELLRTLKLIFDMLVQVVPDLIARAEDFLSQYDIDLAGLISGSGDMPPTVDELRNQLMRALELVISGVSYSTTVVSSFAGAMMDVFFSALFAVYILASKEKLGCQARKLLYAYVPCRPADRAVEVCRLMHSTYSAFISGQCTEALILGCMFFVCMTLLSMPYALLISVFIAVTALIPLVGAWLGCITGALLILMNDPITAVWFVIMFLVLQQIEGNLIYPHVMGNSIGLRPIWTLAAVVIGQGLFGIIGMLVFIPLASVLYTLVRQSANARLSERAVPPDRYSPPDPDAR